MPESPSRRYALRFAAVALAVVALAAGITLIGLADQPFYTKGEPREAMVVWEMAHGGGLVLPYRNGTEIPSKPPFYHWLGLIVSSVAGGVSELTTRLPSAILSIIAALAVFLFGAWTGRIRSGWLAATALVLSFEWLRAARTARVDMTLTFFMAGALLCFAIIDRAGTTLARLIALYACLTAATLGKGPIGVALPALVILVYAAISPPPAEPAGASAWRRRIANVFATVRSLRPVPGLAGVLLIVGAWYAAALWIGGDDFFVKQVLKENVFRVLDPERLDSGHVHGPLYLLPNFLLGALPWSLLAPAIAWWLWRMRPVDRTTRYLVVWFLVVIGFFSLIPSKRSVYILPAYPAAALLFGRVLGPGPEGDGPRRLAAFGIYAGAFAIGLIGFAGLVLASGLPVDRWIAPLLEPDDAQGLAAAVAALVSYRALALLAALATIGGAALAAREAPGAHWLRASVALTAAMVALYGGIASPIERGIADSRTLGPFLAAVRERVGTAKLGFLCAYDYGAVYYSQRYFPHDDQPRCDAHAPVGDRCRDHIREMVREGDCGDREKRLSALRDPAAPRYILVWEDETAPIASEVSVLMKSDGTGPKGRAHLLLVTPNGAGGAGGAS